KVYSAIDPVILASAEANAGFVLTGKADALAKLELGSASAEVTVSSTRTDAIKIAGGSGPVMLDLFRVRWLGEGAGLEGTEEQEASDSHTVAAELDEQWPEEPADDLFASPRPSIG